MRQSVDNYGNRQGVKESVNHFHRKIGFLFLQTQKQKGRILRREVNQM